MFTLIDCSPNKKALVWDVTSSGKRGGNLKEVEAVLEAIGFSVTNTKPNDLSEIDLIWTYDLHLQPFNEGYFDNITKTQRVNHFRQTVILGQKHKISKAFVSLVPMSFNLPEDFDQWKTVASSENAQGLKWVTKSKGHRQVKLIPNPTELTINKLKEAGVDVGDTMIQRFIDKPLLIDNHKFDFGIYVLVTSILPTRAYIHETRFVIRFCQEPYEPFDPDNRMSYVIEEKYKPAEEIPSMEKYFKRKLHRFAAFQAYLQDNGYDEKDFFAKVEDIIIKSLYLSKRRWFPAVEKAIDNESIADDGSSKNFELLRFDFIVEDLGKGKLRPWLMEANFSPNLLAKQHSIGIRQLIFDTFSTLGALRHRKPWEEEEEGKENGEFNIEDLPKLGCDKICKGDDKKEDFCKICSAKVMPKHVAGMIRQTISEHLGKRHFRRIIPMEPTKKMSWKEYMKKSDDVSLDTQSNIDKTLATWFYLACQMQSDWCGI